ncbi:MAG: hypothetical protein E3K40_01485 [Candidatus Brocadia sp.]|nr:hypothetical protein [Candidatus Brocadia sp.]
MRNRGFVDFLWPKTLAIAVLLACIVMTKSADAAADTLPDVVTGVATDVSNGSATLNGTVDINNSSTLAPGYVMFFYGDGNGNYTNISEIISEIGTSTSDGKAQVAIQVDELTSGNIHYKIVGQNNVGTSYGGNSSFTVTGGGNVTLNTVNAPLPNIETTSTPTPAPPVATTGSATFNCEDDGSFTETLCGTVTVSGGLLTKVFFSYTDKNTCCLDNITEIVEILGTTTTTAVDYSICIDQYGLGTETVYHYALWAQNKWDKVVRNDQGDCEEFTTPTCDKGGETAVELASFTAGSVGEGKVALNWKTATEVNNAGFNLYRSRLLDGIYKKINEEGLIPAQGDATAGASYRYEDTPSARGTYYYKLEDVDTNGVTTMHGPEKVRVRSTDRDARRSKGQKNK